MVFWGIFSVSLGYLLGSISPSYILGRLLRGIDIREHGTHNAGARNVKKILGWWPFIVTVIYDLSKGLLAMLIAWKLGVSEPIIYLSGYAAVLGHIFPFYLKFRGGEGQATAVGIFFYLLIKIFLNGWFPFEILLLVGIFAIFIYAVTDLAEIVGLFALPVFILLFLAETQINPTTIFASIIMFQMFIITLYNVRKFDLLVLKPKAAKDIKFWRTILRPLAVIFPILYLNIDQKIVLIIIGSIGIVFLIADIVRLLHSGTNIFLFRNATILFKEKETHNFSSMTQFLVASFLLVLLFPKGIAILAMVFLIFGDIFAKIIGLQYGKIRIFKKTLEGSAAYFFGSIIFGIIFLRFFDVPVWIFLAGALAATLTELFPVGIDDNFSVGLISASVMYVLQRFA